MVPTLVPIDIEMKQDARKSPAKRNFPGSIFSVILTAASMAPISFAVEAKAPARMKIHIISNTFLLPAPWENMEMRSSNEYPLHDNTAYTDETRNAEAIGIL